MCVLRYARILMRNERPRRVLRDLHDEMFYDATREAVRESTRLRRDLAFQLRYENPRTDSGPDFEDALIGIHRPDYTLSDEELTLAVEGTRGWQELDRVLAEHGQQRFVVGE